MRGCRARPGSEGFGPRLQIGKKLAIYMTAWQDIGCDVTWYSFQGRRMTTPVPRSSMITRSTAVTGKHDHGGPG
jgi:hypothetical protein